MVKQFNTTRNIGKVKYIIGHYDGCSTHKDGSPFWDIYCCKSLKAMNKRKRELEAKGYLDVDKTPVVFRILNNEVIALFPTIGNNKYIQSYMHVGQHSDACPELINELKPATKKQYSDLLNELISIGYTDIKIYNKYVFI
jgi:hypothetical protein